MKQETGKRVLAIGAHDDDVIIGIGGTLLVRHQDDGVEIIVMTNGQNSHEVVLGVSVLPSPEEVAQARKE